MSKINPAIPVQRAGINPGGPSLPRIDPRIPAEGKPKWVFSFRYWRQIENFGFDRSNADWFVSLLDCFKSYSEMEIETFKKDRRLQGQSRYHTINWQQKNIPIRRDQLDWLPPDIRENETDFPFYQIQVSTSLGRIIGFWWENVFNIVLLDPLHNLQPAESFGFKVDECRPLNYHYADLMDKIEQFSYSYKCDSPNCGYLEGLPALKAKPKMYQNVVLHFADDQLIQRAEELLDKRKASSYAELLELGIAFAESV